MPSRMMTQQTLQPSQRLRRNLSLRKSYYDCFWRKLNSQKRDAATSRVLLLEGGVPFSRAFMFGAREKKINHSAC